MSNAGVSTSAHAPPLLLTSARTSGATSAMESRPSDAGTSTKKDVEEVASSAKTDRRKMATVEDVDDVPDPDEDDLDDLDGKFWGGR